MTATLERGTLGEFGINAGAIHAIKTPDHRYLFIQNKCSLPNDKMFPFEDQSPRTRVPWLVPIQSIEGELLPILQKQDSSITAQDFVSIYRQRIELEPPNLEEEAKATAPRYIRVFDTHIRDGHVFTAIQKAVKEGTGLALLSPAQVEYSVGSGTEIKDEETIAAIMADNKKEQLVFNKTGTVIVTNRGALLKTSLEGIKPKFYGDVKPVVINEGKKPIEAAVSSRCKFVLDSCVSTYREKLLPRQENFLKNLAETIAFKPEGTPPGPQYRLGLEDLELLSKFADPELVVKLKDNLTWYRAGIFLTKFFEGAAEGGMVATVLSSLHGKPLDVGIRVATALGMLATYIAGKVTEESAEEAVSKSLSAVLHSMVKTYTRENRVFDRQNTVSEEIHDIVTRLARAEKVSPGIVEVGPSAIAVNGALAWGGEISTGIVPAATLMGTELTLHLALQNKYTFLKHPLIKYLAPAVSGVLTFAPMVPAVFGPDFTHAIQEVGLHVAAIGLTTHHLSSQLNSSRVMLDGYEALSELREWLETLKITVATKALRREHGLTMLLGDTGVIYVSRAKMKPNTKESIPTPKTTRYKLLDEAEDAWLREASAKRRKGTDINSLKGKEFAAYIKSERSRKRTVLSPAILFHDYTIAMGDTIFLEDAGLYLQSGIHELTLPIRKGKTIILKSLADQIAHAKGRAFLRTKATDLDIHGEPNKQLVGYYDCSGESHDNLPDFFRGDNERFAQYKKIWTEDDDSFRAAYGDLLATETNEEKKEKMMAIIAFFKETGMLDPQEVISYFSKGKLSVSCRSRLWIAYAGWRKDSVILLDTPFDNDLISPAVVEDADNIGKYFNHLRSAARGMPTLLFANSFLKELEAKYPDVTIDEELDRSLDRLNFTTDFLNDLVEREHRIILFSSTRRGDDSHTGYREFLKKLQSFQSIYSVDEGSRKFVYLAKKGSPASLRVYRKKRRKEKNE